MKTRVAAACAALLLVPSLWCGELASAQTGPGPGAQQRGARPPYGYHGMSGWGMMGGWGGPGMMGGWGGPGMMGGWGGGGGWMGGPAWGALDLTQEQRNKIYAIQRDLREKQFALMDSMHETMQSRDFYRNGKFDEKAARNAYAAAEKIHRQMFENMLDAQKRVDAVLTPQQRQELGRSGQ